MSQIMISLQMIRDKSPCASGWKKVKEANAHREMNDLFPVSDILVSNDLSDTLWATRCIVDKDKLFRKFALWCAKQSLQFTTDKRVSDCLDVVEKYIDGNATIEDLMQARRAADYAAADAYDHTAAHAAHAAYAAVSAASAAAAASASAASAAAAHAAHAAHAAYAADADARREIQAKQETKLKQILDAGVWVD